MNDVLFYLLVNAALVLDLFSTRISGYPPFPCFASFKGWHLYQSNFWKEAEQTPDEDRDNTDPNNRLAFKNFWGSTSFSAVDSGQSNCLPCVPSLDRCGLLPPGAYVSSPSPICRISMAIDLRRQDGDDDLGPKETVLAMQNFVEDGLTSFQLEAVSSSTELIAWGEEEVYRRFLKESPGSILRHSHLTVPLKMPLERFAGSSLRSARTEISNSLFRMGSPEAIHCVQLYPQQGPEEMSNNFWILDALDALEELKREGLVLSVSGRNLPPSVVQGASDCGFSALCRNQIDVNIADTGKYNTIDSGLPLEATASLLGGLLSDNSVGKKSIPASNKLALNAQRHVRNSIPKWAAGGQENYANTVFAWWKFQTDFLPVLEDIGHKHDVPIASIALRWTLQLKHVDTVVVLTRLSGSDETGFPRLLRKQQYRDVFKFELDEEDMTRLWKIARVFDVKDL
ncbi:hypothetical protein ACA910_000522 [Epithemia clementina (nom. ined.)]